MHRNRVYYTYNYRVYYTYRTHRNEVRIFFLVTRAQRKKTQTRQTMTDLRAARLLVGLELIARSLTRLCAPHRTNKSARSHARIRRRRTNRADADKTNTKSYSRGVDRMIHQMLRRARNSIPTSTEEIQPKPMGIFKSLHLQRGRRSQIICILPSPGQR